MIKWLGFLLGLTVSALKAGRDLVLENVALRHQLLVLSRNAQRPQWRPWDRVLWGLAFARLEPMEKCASLGRNVRKLAHGMFRRLRGSSSGAVHPTARDRRQNQICPSLPRMDATNEAWLFCQDFRRPRPGMLADDGVALLGPALRSSNSSVLGQRSDRQVGRNQSFGSAEWCSAHAASRHS